MNNDDDRWDDLNNFKTCPLCGTDGSLFVDILEDHNKDTERLVKLVKENERLKKKIEAQKEFIEEAKRLVKGLNYQLETRTNLDYKCKLCGCVELPSSHCPFCRRKKEQP